MMSGDAGELRRGPWTLEEDNLLIQYITCHGEGRWNSLSKCAGLKRTGKSCRLRWLNYLKPDIKRGDLTPHEQLLILELHSKWGNRWSRIAQNLPGRTDNEIKNYWRTRVQKQARQLKVDSNSKKFLEAIRMFWMPRLLEKMEQNSSSPSFSSVETQKFTSPSPALDQFPLPPKLLDSNNSSSANFLEASGCLTLNPPDAEACSEFQSEKTLEGECYQVGFPIYGMPELDHHVADLDWFCDDLEYNFWNTDELWQFRKPGEVGAKIKLKSG